MNHSELAKNIIAEFCLESSRNAFFQGQFHVSSFPQVDFFCRPPRNEFDSSLRPYAPTELNALHRKALGPLNKTLGPKTIENLTFQSSISVNQQTNWTSRPNETSERAETLREVAHTYKCRSLWGERSFGSLLRTRLVGTGYL